MLSIDKANDEFLYAQVMDLVNEQLEAGALRPGDRLPSLRRMSDKLRISIPTVRQAYLELERLGRVEASAEHLGAFALVKGHERLSTVLPSRGVAVAGVAPNPFNPRTRISFLLAETGRTTVTLYDIRGTLVRTLVKGRLDRGAHELIWDGTNDRGQTVASGVYFLAIRGAGDVATRKLVMVR